MGLGIMNITGDESGEEIFIGKIGHSVINYIIGNTESWQEIQKMKIGDRTESDHRPIEIILNKQIDRMRDKEEEREIEDWTEEGHAEYKRKLKEGREAKEEETDGWEKLKRDISKAIVKKKIKVKKAMPGRRKW